MRTWLKVILFPCLLLSQRAFSQETPDSLDINRLLAKNQEKYINALSEKSDRLTGTVDRKTEKYLYRLQQEENRVFSKLSRIDSNAAKKYLASSQEQYQKLKSDIENKAASLFKGSGRYMPWIDSAANSLKFLQNTNPVFSKYGQASSQIKQALGKVNALEEEFKKAENIQEFIKQRKEILKEQLASYRLGEELKYFNKDAYYYAQQINEYKAAWDDPNKMERKVMDLLNQLPAFKEFMKKNSMLAGLFDIPQDYAATDVGGLQTREAVQQLISQRVMLQGPNGMQAAQANVLDAQSQLAQLRNKFMNTGSGGEMPDFKPNEEKTKTFLKRLQYGINAQTTHSTWYFPTTTDIGFSVGYKINDKNTVGIGASAKIGWGSDYQHIHITGQGVGLRSFVDLKIKGNFYASGGLEYNYQQVFTQFRQLPGVDSWQKSGLIGISKMVSLRSKMIKQTKLQLLWDFLSYYQMPRTQPIKFRIGYNF